ncbi:aminotransferase class IV [Sphingomonas daechungensis]|uniref:aminotransferase class IV n=1 Tax=Sphingomonas daechungensis TaxID=1176646 RepID=UPI0021D51EEE|nr:aminotransferase class IV [Sphingomonas daechungensis]
MSIKSACRSATYIRRLSRLAKLTDGHQASPMAQSMHDVSDPRNASILINVNGELKPRDQAVVSVFDSGFMLGDGVWEGLRVHQGRFAFLDRHLDRLFEGAKAIAMDVGLTLDELTERLYETLDANGMDEGVHTRLIVSRGVRSTPYQDPRVVVGGSTIVIIPNTRNRPKAFTNAGSSCSPCTCAAATRRSRIRSSIPCRSSIASRPASRPRRQAPTRG